jgi:photosystem II stability/assembly factor-like uncharacterized protein
MKRFHQFLIISIEVLFFTSIMKAQWDLYYPDIPPDQINDVLFLDESTGFAVNSGGSILMTTDSGNSWKIKAHYQRNAFLEIKFLDLKNGFVISPYSAYNADVSFIYTTDSGLHWDQGNIYMGDAVTFLPLSTSKILKSYEGSIRKLDNFFGLWNTTYQTPHFSEGDIGMIPYGDIIQFQLLHSGRILALGSSDRAKHSGIISDSATFILKSDNDGSKWDTLWCGLPYSSETFFFFNDSVGWLGAESDRIYKTNDGGVSWSLEYSDSLHAFPIKSISSEDGIHIYAADGSGRVIYSNTGGQEWQYTQVSQYQNYPFTIQFLNSTKGFLAGPDFWVTTDGAQSWERVSKSLKGNFSKIDFVSEDIGMGVGGCYIYKTLDGGHSWTQIYESSDQNFSGLKMLDSLHIWVTGYDSVFSSTDGGISWFSPKLNEDAGQVRGVDFLDSKTGIVFSGTTYNYVTTDGGGSWKKYAISDTQFITSLNKVQFTDPGHLWFANQSGVWLSRDTARTWTLFPIENAFAPFDFVDSLYGWLTIWGGQYKRIAFTSDGGLSWNYIDKPYAFQTTDMTTYREGNFYGGIVMFEAGYDGSLLKYRQGDSYIYKIPTYTGNPLNSFASHRKGNNLHLWVAGDGMTLLHSVEYTTDEVEEPNLIITKYALFQNYPNPFNPSTKITFTIGKYIYTNLRIYDILGREVITLVNGMQFAGEHTIDWSGTNSAGQKVCSGIYFYRLQAGEYVETKKLVLLK